MSYIDAGQIEDPDKTYKDFEQSIDKIYQEPPKIDISEAVKEFCEGLRIVEKEQRIPRLDKHVSTLVAEKLSGWVDAMKPLSAISTNLHHAFNDIDDNEDLIRKKKKVAEGNIEVGKTELLGLERKRKRNSEERLSDSGTTGSFGKWTAWGMVIISILVGLLTAYYYTGVQGRIQIAQSGGQMGTLTLENFSVSKFLEKSPFNFIYIFGALIFLAAGKIVSLIYSKLGHATSMFITVSILTLMLTAASVFLFAIVQTQATNNSVATKELQNAKSNAQIIDLFDGGTKNACEINPIPKDKIQICEKISSLKTDVEDTKQALSGYSFWLTIIVMLSEIGLGSIAWMLMSSYYERILPGDKVTEKKIEIIDDQIKQQKKLISQYENDIIVLDTKQKNLTKLKTNLKTLQAKALSSDQLVEKTNQIIKAEKARADSLLLNIENAWHANSPTS